MIGDPYEAADNQQRQEEAKLVTPEPAKKNRKLAYAAMVLVAGLLGLVILAQIASYVARNASQGNAQQGQKPTTMTRNEGDTFAQQQSGIAGYMRGEDRNKKNTKAEDTVLGQSADLAGPPADDSFDEADGVPKKTKAQDDAEHGRNAGGQGGGKSEAQQLAERAALETSHRRQNDMDSSPVSIDFSDYFDKQKEQAASPTALKPDPTETAEANPPQHSRAALTDAPADQGEDGESSRDKEKASAKKTHDPRADYEFDASSGKLYRLIEDTILETVLVNRLTGASVGPVITMITTDVYSESGSHLLIPKGTRLLGHVSAVASVNQERLFVAFHRMIMPDGYSVSLDKFQGLDVVGQSGLVDLVNHHYLRIFGASLALAAISATAQIGNNSAYGSYDWGVQMRSNASEGLGQSAQRIMERFMNTLPTFTIRERARVKIMLANDLVLPDIKNHNMDPDL